MPGRGGPGIQQPGKGLQKAQVRAGSDQAVVVLNVVRRGAIKEERGALLARAQRARPAVSGSGSGNPPRQFFGCDPTAPTLSSAPAQAQPGTPAPAGRVPTPPQPCRPALGPAAAAPAWSRRAPPAPRHPLGPSPSFFPRGPRASALRPPPTRSPPCLWSSRRPSR